MYSVGFYSIAYEYERLFVEWSLSAQKEDHVMENENPDRTIMEYIFYRLGWFFDYPLTFLNTRLYCTQFRAYLSQILDYPRFPYFAILLPKYLQVYRLDFELRNNKEILTVIFEYKRIIKLTHLFSIRFQ